MDKLSSKHFMFFILGCSMIALRSYSSIFVRLGGRDTWILAFFASIVFIVITMYLLNICIKSQTFNIKDIFFSYFSMEQVKRMKEILEKGYYIPAQQATPEEVATVKQQVSQG